MRLRELSLSPVLVLFLRFSCVSPFFEIVLFVETVCKGARADRTENVGANVIPFWNGVVFGFACAEMGDCLRREVGALVTPMSECE